MHVGLVSFGACPFAAESARMVFAIILVSVVSRNLG